MYNEDFESADDVKHLTNGVNSKIPSSHNFAADYMDSFTEEDGAYFETEEMREARLESAAALDNRVKKTLEIAKRELTERQYQVLILMTGYYDGNIMGNFDDVKPLSEREVALRLGINQSTVHRTFTRACEILKRFEHEVY